MSHRRCLFVFLGYLLGLPTMVQAEQPFRVMDLGHILASYPGDTTTLRIGPGVNFRESLVFNVGRLDGSAYQLWRFDGLLLYRVRTLSDAGPAIIKAFDNQLFQSVPQRAGNLRFAGYNLFRNSEAAVISDASLLVREVLDGKLYVDEVIQPPIIAAPTYRVWRFDNGLAPPTVQADIPVSVSQPVYGRVRGTTQIWTCDTPRRCRLWQDGDEGVMPLTTIDFSQDSPDFVAAHDQWYIAHDRTLSRLTAGVLQPLIDSATGQAAVIDIPRLYRVGDLLLVESRDVDRGSRLWIVDGARLRPLSDLSREALGSVLDDSVKRCGSAVCLVTVTRDGRSLWRFNGTSLSRLDTLPSTSAPVAMPVNNYLYLVADDLEVTPGLLRSNGSSVETLAPELCEVRFLGERQAGLHIIARPCSDASNRLGIWRFPITTDPLLAQSINTQLPSGTITPGIIVSGAPTQVVVFAEGQGADALPDPRLTLRRLNGGAVLADNDNWGNHPSRFQVALSARHPYRAEDAAVSTTLEPGAYIVETSDSQNRGGRVLVSIQHTSATGELRALSANTPVTASGVQPGFIVERFGRFVIFAEAQDASIDPLLRVLRFPDGSEVASNDDWQDHPTRDQVIAEARRPTSDRDAALVVPLLPGAYFSETLDANGGAGQVLISIQRLD